MGGDTSLAARPLLGAGVTAGAANPEPHLQSIGGGLDRYRGAHRRESRSAYHEFVRPGPSMCRGESAGAIGLQFINLCLGAIEQNNLCIPNRSAAGVDHLARELSDSQFVSRALTLIHEPQTTTRRAEVNVQMLGGCAIVHNNWNSSGDRLAPPIALAGWL